VDPVRVVDLRLLAVGAVGWLAVIWGMGRSTPTLLVVCGACGLIALVGLTTRYRLALAASLGALVVVLLLVPLAGRQTHWRTAPLTQLATRRAAASLELTASGDPVPLATRGPDGRPRIAVSANARRVINGDRSSAAGGHVLILASASGWDGVLPGQRLRIEGRLGLPQRNGDLSVTLFASTTPTLIGRPPWYQQMAGRVRAALRDSCAGLPTQVRGLLPGLIDGDTSNLDPVLKEHFRLAGLTHLVAVSGTNCSILLGTALLLLRRARARPWVCAAVGLGVLVGFVLIARPSPSVLRAAVMGLVTLVGLATGRPRAALPALGFSVIALLFFDPSLAVDAGFAMSVLATAALLMIAPSWAHALRRRRVPPGLAEALAVASAAHLVTAPIAAALSGKVSLSAIPANVLVEPLVVPATILGFAAALVAPFWLGPGAVLAWLASWPCRWLVLVADHLGTVHGANLPWPGGAVGGLALAALSLIVVLLARSAAARTGLIAVAVAGLLIQMPVRQLATAWPPAAGWDFVTCDIGQGDGLVLNAGTGSAVVIDTGPDPVQMDRCLSDLGVRDVPLLAISHFHLDHVAGLAGVLRGRTVGRVITGPLQDPESGVELVRTQLAAATTVSSPASGARFTVGRVSLEVLAPVVTLHDTRSDPNNESLVIRASVGDLRILLPGDAEVEEQQTLLDAGVDLRADVLKVPHHGSAYSLPEFFAATHAQVALVSCGLNNDYGHPAPQLVSTLARLGIPMRRTDRDGDLAVRGPPAHLTVTVRGKANSAVGS
jgi:competence protein ComEC